MLEKALDEVRAAEEMKLLNENLVKRTVGIKVRKVGRGVKEVDDLLGVGFGAEDG